MDRTLEEKIRRAEEIYARRHGESVGSTRTVKLMDSKNKKDVKLLKKMLIQVVVCVLIYLVIYVVQNSEFIFSEQFLKNVNEILSYDTNFKEIYDNAKNYFVQLFQNNSGNTDNNEQNSEQNNTQENEQNNSEQENTVANSIENVAIGGADGGGENANVVNSDANSVNGQNNMTQEEQDIANIKQTTSFIKPIEGTITSNFGNRNPTTKTVPTNHTGTDIAANTGTKILSATDGEVVLRSEEGDYGKHLKIQIGEVSIIYAHCNQLYVEQGQTVKQGQEIAEVGSTGNSTGPHLHFEIRYQERVIDPQKILEL